MRNIRRAISVVAAILVLSVANGVSASTPYPPTKTVPVADTYYGHTLPTHIDGSSFFEKELR